MSYLEELLPEFRKGAKIRLSSWSKDKFIVMRDKDIVLSLIHISEPTRP